MSKRVRITNESVNSYGFRVLTSGIDLEQYRRNPVLLYMHERGNVIGYIDGLQVENGEVTGELVFDEASELSTRCKKQYEVGSLRMVSILRARPDQQSPSASWLRCHLWISEPMTMPLPCTMKVRLLNWRKTATACCHY